MIKFLFSLVVAFLILAFFAQNSLIYYANSRFGSNFGLEEYLANSPLRFGGELQSNISQKIQNFTPNLKAKIASLSPQTATYTLASNTAPIIAPSDKDAIIERELKKIEAVKLTDTTLPKIDNNKSANLTAPKPSEANLTAPVSKPKIAKKSNEKIALKAGQTVLFIGDSLMQYVGMSAKKFFPKSGLKVLDLSKQSTGLVDKKGHNWQQVLSENLANNENIGLVVVFLGANDTHPRKINGAVRSVGSEVWSEFYASRVREIYDTAEKYGAKVLWLGLPCMNEAKFEQKTEAINKVYKSVNKEFGEIYMPTSPFVCENGAYKVYLKNGKNQIRVRQDDGIHISKKGCEIITQKILARISVE